MEISKRKGLLARKEEERRGLERGWASLLFQNLAVRFTGQEGKIAGCC